MISLKLDGSGDIALTNGSPSLIEGADALVQKVGIKLRFFQGEWFLDLLFGMPYHGRILVRGVNEADVYQIFQSEIEKIPGIVAVEELKIDFGDSDNRVMRVTGRAVGSSGEEVPINTESP